jgi:hypothetical protein
LKVISNRSTCFNKVLLYWVIQNDCGV